MYYLDAVSSEGGPLLIADAETARKWRGFGEEDGDGEDYKIACDALEASATRPPGLELQTGDSSYVIWDMGGSGTADILRVSLNEIMIVRAWLDDESDLPEILEMAGKPAPDRRHFANLRVDCGVLAILWAPGSGTCIEPADISEIENFQSPSGDIAIDGSALLVELSNGVYSLFYDEVELASGESAVRCHIIDRDIEN